MERRDLGRAEAVLAFEGVDFCYGDQVVFRGLDLNISKGIVTALIGANGSGKSTILGLATKNLRPQSGVVRLWGSDVATLRPRDLARLVAVVHQKNRAPEDLSVRSLVSYGRFAHRRRGLRFAQDGEDVRMVGWALEATGLAMLADRPLGELSGGEVQRAWVAMALAQGSQVLLLDEPTTFLDLRHQIELLRLVRRLNREHGMTVLMVLHDVNQALCYGDEIVALARGGVVAQGPPRAVVSEGLLEEVYGARLRVAGLGGAPFVYDDGAALGSACAREKAQRAGAASAAGAQVGTADATCAPPADGRKVAKGAWALAGFVAFGLGMAGAFLPVLPTTPFVLLAAFCFARSSKRLNAWFVQTRIYKDVLKSYVDKRQMTLGAKLLVLVPMTALMGVGFALMGRVPLGRAALAFVWLAHVVYFLLVVKTRRGGGVD